MLEKSPETLSLADWLQNAQNAAQNSDAQQKNSFWQGRLQTKPYKVERLPSGLRVEEAANMATALATASRQLRRTGKTLVSQPQLEAITLQNIGNDWQVDLPAEVANSVQEQTALTQILYSLVTGKASVNLAQDIQGLAITYPDTAQVLQAASVNAYNSTTELAGAFGWSLYRRDQIQQSFLLNNKRHLTLWPKRFDKAKSIQLLVNPTFAQPKTNPKVNSMMAMGSLAVAMLLLVGFIVYSVANSPINNDTFAARQTPSPKAETVATPTPNFLQVTKASDGSQVTKFNPALADPNDLKFVPPNNLAGGAVSLLSGSRIIQVSNLQWDDATNVKLSLNDGSWENWDVVGKKRLTRHDLPSPEQYAGVSWSPNGNAFAALSQDGQLKLGIAGRVLKNQAFTRDSNTGYFDQSMFSWSPDSHYLLIRSTGGNSEVWNFPDDGQPALKIPEIRGQGGWQGFGRSWAWDKTNTHLAILDGNKVSVYTIAGSSFIYTFTLDEYVNKIAVEPNRGFETSLLAWSPDGRYMAMARWANGDPSGSTTGKGYMLIWEMPTGASVQTGNTRPQNVQTIEIPTVGSLYGGLEWSTDSRLALAFGEGQSGKSHLQIYQRDTAKVWSKTLDQSVANLNDPFALAWSPSGNQIILSNFSGGLTLYATDSGLASSIIENNPYHYRLGVHSPDGKLLVVQDGEKYNMLDVNNRKILQTFDPPTGNWQHYSGVQAGINWSPNGQYVVILYSTPHDNTTTNSIPQVVARIWQLNGTSATLYGDILLPDPYRNGLGWNVKNNQAYPLLEFTDGNIGLWDLSKKMPTLEEQQAEQIPLAGPGSVKVSPSQADLPYTIIGHLPQPSEIIDNTFGLRKWSKDWKLVATQTDSSSNGVYGILKTSPSDNSLSQKTNVAQLDPNPNKGRFWGSDTNTDFSPDNKLLAIGLDNGLLQLYNTDNGKLVRAVSAHTGQVTSVIFSPDGKFLATAATDRTVKIWDTVTWRTVNVLRGYPYIFYNLEWLGDGKSLAAYDHWNVIYWRVK